MRLPTAQEATVCSVPMPSVQGKLFGLWINSLLRAQASMRQLVTVGKKEGKFKCREGREGMKPAGH